MDVSSLCWKSHLQPRTHSGWYAKRLCKQGGSYDLLGMNTQEYQKIIPKTKELIAFCRSKGIPIFYTEAVREASGIDLLTRVHRLLPLAREERLKVPITVRGTWDAQIIDEIKPT